MCTLCDRVFILFVFAVEFNTSVVPYLSSRNFVIAMLLGDKVTENLERYCFVALMACGHCGVYNGIGRKGCHP